MPKTKRPMPKRKRNWPPKSSVLRRAVKVWGISGSEEDGTRPVRVMGSGPSSSFRSMKCTSTIPISPRGMLMMKHHLQLAEVRYPPIIGPTP